MNEILPIKASWLNDHEYCEYKWYFQNVLGEEIPKTTAMIRGNEIHEKKESEFLKVAVPTTKEEFLKSTKYTITKEIPLKKEFEDFVLLGVIDELGIDANNVYVIDDKPRAKPYMGARRQVWAYCLLFESNFKINKKIYSIIRDRDTNTEVWREEYTEDNKKSVLEVIGRIKKLLRKEVKPKTCEIPAKCNACILHQTKRCKYSVGYQ
ncbi:CRISPR-associated protein Cas4 [Candidatus Woesearchaeota archaeon]|nr:CRISPR-associated protein Cas4 [Candidatus Woesearchaeota archaeon]